VRSEPGRGTSSRSCQCTATTTTRESLRAPKASSSAPTASSTPNPAPPSASGTLWNLAPSPTAASASSPARTSATLSPPALSARTMAGPASSRRADRRRTSIGRRSPAGRWRSATSGRWCSLMGRSCIGCVFRVGCSALLRVRHPERGQQVGPKPLHLHAPLHRGGCGLRRQELAAERTAFPEAAGLTRHHRRRRPTRPGPADRVGARRRYRQAMT
jgi:hypothetical protein